jgi:TonB family protein
MLPRDIPAAFRHVCLQGPFLPQRGGEAFRGHPFTVSVAPQNHPVSEAPASSVPQAAGVRAEKLVLLANDESLIEALASVVPSDSLTVVADEAALAGQLVGGQAGVAFIDCGSADSQPGRTAQLTRRLHQQLPDVVLVVAGDGAAQSEVAALVADGTIYRFVHKPVSAQRLKLFVDAAVRKRTGLSSGVYSSLPISQQPAFAAPTRAVPWRVLLAVAAAAVLVMGAVGWLLLRSHSVTSANSPRQGAPRTAPPVAAPSGATRDFNMPAPVTASSVSASTKAADLDRLATAAEQALLAGNLVEATRLTEAARDVDPDHVRVKFLTAQIASEQTRASAQRRAAAASSPNHATASAASAPTPATVLPTSVPAARPASSAPASAAAAAADSDTLPLLPIVAASATTAVGVSVASSPTPASPPSSTPPASEARDRNSVAAIVLQRLYSPDPEFPERARELDLTGFVDLEFTVLSDGSVTKVTVLKAQPVGVFENAAVAAVSHWRYRPIDRDGAPVSQHARLRLNFAYK